MLGREYGIGPQVTTVSFGQQVVFASTAQRATRRSGRYNGVAVLSICSHQYMLARIIHRKDRRVRGEEG